MMHYECWKDHDGSNESIRGGQEWVQACAISNNDELP